MHTLQKNAEEIRKLIAGANDVTGDNTTNLTDAVDSLIDKRKQIRESVANEIGIKATVGGEHLIIDDASDIAPLGMKVYGKSWQNDIPSIHEPQTIYSHGEDGIIEYYLYGRNMFEKITGVGFDETVSEDGLTVTSGVKTGARSYDQLLLYHDEIFLKAGITYYISADIKLDSGTMQRIYDMRCQDDRGDEIDKSVVKISAPNSITNAYQHHKYSFTPTRDTIAKSILIKGYGGDAAVCTVTNIKLSTVNDNVYTPCNKTNQSLTLQSPNGLKGIPVSSNGNYTDSNGQQWICDEIDLTRGKYIQRIQEYTFTGDEEWKKSSLVVPYYSSFYVDEVNFDIEGDSFKLCTHFQHRSNSSWTDLTRDEFIENPQGEGRNSVGIRLTTSILNTDDVAGFKKFLKANNVSFIYILKTPIERDLSAEELAHFKALKMNSVKEDQITTIFNDENVYTEVHYIVDTDKYIMNLTNSVLNLGGDV